MSRAKFQTFPLAEHLNLEELDHELTIRDQPESAFKLDIQGKQRQLRVLLKEDQKNLTNYRSKINIRNEVDLIGTTVDNLENAIERKVDPKSESRVLHYWYRAKRCLAEGDEEKELRRNLVRKIERLMKKAQIGPPLSPYKDQINRILEQTDETLGDSGAQATTPVGTPKVVKPNTTGKQTATSKESTVGLLTPVQPWKPMPPPVDKVAQSTASETEGAAAWPRNSKTKRTPPRENLFDFPEQTMPKPEEERNRSPKGAIPKNPKQEPMIMVKESEWNEMRCTLAVLLAEDGKRKKQSETESESKMISSKTTRTRRDPSSSSSEEDFKKKNTDRGRQHSNDGSNSGENRHDQRSRIDRNGNADRNQRNGRNQYANRENRHDRDDNREYRRNRDDNRENRRNGNDSHDEDEDRDDNRRNRRRDQRYNYSPSPDRNQNRGWHRGQGFEADRRKNRIEKWKVRFSGDSKGMEVESFLYKAKKLADLEGISKRILLRDIHLLLEATALEWFFTYIEDFDCWDAFEESIIFRFGNPNKDQGNRTKIRDRLQQKGESFVAFVSEIEKLNLMLSKPLSRRRFEVRSDLGQHAPALPFKNFDRRSERSRTADLAQPQD